MKIAFLFSGQLREVSLDLFRRSLLNLTKDIDYAIFAYCWEEEGKSLNHKYKLPNTNLVQNIDQKIYKMFNEFNLLNFSYESFKNFDEKISLDHQNILNSKKFHFGTVNSLPQIYTLHKSFELLKKSNYHYDLVFKCRFDSIFVHPFKLLSPEEILVNNNLYNLNFGRAYYPKRIYDVFFGGSRKSMNFLSNIWEELPSLVRSKFNNGLDNRDCCRILYLAAKLNNIEVTSFSSRICDVYRGDDYEYSEYLIKSHLIISSLNNKNIIILKSIFKWFRERNLSNSRILFFLINAFLYFPLAYLKRLRYLKIC
tara:strand:+ start:6913 stop:7845 length:933 start_codon:yes stop_codon:yes gene_type:complete